MVRAWANAYHGAADPDDVILNQAHHPLSIDQGFHFFCRASRIIPQMILHHCALWELAKIGEACL